MRFVREQEQEEEKIGVNMTPLIDLVFILLVYFLLTMTFVPDEKWISSILEKGGVNGPAEIITEKINITFVPADMPADDSSRVLENWYQERMQRDAVECRMNGAVMRLDKSVSEEEQLNRIHAFIIEHLHKRELQTATRAQQDPVVLHCFERLPWRYALAAFDAVRAYEEEASGLHHNMMERSFDFAQGELRGTHAFALGSELQRLRTLH